MNIKSLNLKLILGIVYLAIISFGVYFLLTKKPTKPIILHYHGASSKIQQINFKILE
jgi:hypothetical protein